MTETKKIISAIVIVAVILIGVGYAAINQITVEINGALSATTSNENFKVKLTDAKATDSRVEASVTSDLVGVLNVSGLSAKGESVTATYTIQNASDDLSANLTSAASWNNKEYFNVTTSLSTANIAKSATATLTVTVELIKTPIDADVSDTVGVTVVASPVQPQ